MKQLQFFFGFNDLKIARIRGQVSRNSYPNAGELSDFGLVHGCHSFLTLSTIFMLAKHFSDRLSSSPFIGSGEGRWITFGSQAGDLGVYFWKDFLRQLSFGGITV